MTISTKTIKGFKTIALIAIIWNLFGVISYLMHAFMTPETIATLPEDQQNFMNNIPSWRMVVFALATFGGLLASILLLLKKKLAITLFALSFIAIMIGNYYDVIMVNHYKNAGFSGLILPIFIGLVALFLLWYSQKKLN